MNNKGFGLPELLVFIGASLFILVAFMIYWNKENNNQTFKEKTNSSNQNTNINITPSTIEIPEEYIQLENKIKEVSKKYKINKNENIIISLNKLKQANLLNDLKDPNDDTISCNGYVIYNSTKKEYVPYINCPGMYTTNNYNADFE